MGLTIRAYRWFLKLYPAAFREEYADQLERQVRDELAESRGLGSLAALWLRLLLDFAVSVPAQFTREIMQDSRQAAPRNYPSLHMAEKQFHDWVKQSVYLEDEATFDGGDLNLGVVSEAARVHLTETSWNFFSLLGTQPALGRAFAPEEDTPGRDGVAVIGYGLWQQLFGGDLKALGKTIQLDGASLTVIGVAPPGFDFPEKTAVWTPTFFDPPRIPKTSFIAGQVLRLKERMPWAQASAEFAAEIARLAPERINRAHPPFLVPLKDTLVGPVKAASLMLMAAVALVLLIACTNVANLLLARTAGRTNELSIRSALGASRARLSRQLLTESVLLSLAASFAGLLVAQGAVAVATKIQPAPIAAQTYSILDGHVLGFAFAISVLCGLLFGVLPALYAARAPTFAARGSTGRSSSRAIREALVGAQVMLTIVLLASSLSMGRAFLNLAGMDRGFDRQGVVTMSLSVVGTKEQGDPALPYFQQVVRRVRGLPGVRAASLAEFLPLKATLFMGGPFFVDGQRSKENAMIVPVLPDYFQTMGGHIIYGREFTDAEIQSGAQVAVVNDLLAKEFGNPADIVGHRLRAGPGSITIIGVVKDLVYIGDANVTQIYVPDHTPGRYFTTLVARVSGRPENRLAMVRDAVKSVDAQIPVYDVKTMDQLLDDALARPKFYSGTVLFFAGFALLLAVIGIYGVMSYTVEQRTHEMGVRLALGTPPARLRGTLLRQGLITVIGGGAPGIAGAILAGKFVQSLVDGAKPAGADICGMAFLCVAATAAAAIWIASRRVARLDIMDVLRSE